MFTSLTEAFAFKFQVIVHCVAAGEKDGTMFFKDAAESTSFAAVKDKTTATFEIPVKSVDNLVPSSENIFLFKTDTQGFELGVLKGAKRVLSDDSVFLLVVEFSYFLLRNAGTEPLALLHFIYDLGFVCTYMAFHTRMATSRDTSMPHYSVIKYYPDSETPDTLSFEDFIESLRLVRAPGTAGVSGWTDLLCLKP